MASPVFPPRLKNSCLLTLLFFLLWSRADGSSFTCMGRTGYYPHPTSCSQFVACVRGWRFVMSCPAGLHYNASLKLCDWPSSTSCIPPQAPGSPPPSGCDMLCPPHVTYYEFPDWIDCSRHYVCMRGTLTGPVSCPDGLYYDFMSWTCSYKEDVTCLTP